MADLTAIPSSVLVAQASPAATGVTHPDSSLEALLA
ncbi:uncharacterized protein METZ01_LOCUS489340, partial [marine metagenome]